MFTINLSQILLQKYAPLPFLSNQEDLFSRTTFFAFSDIISGILIIFFYPLLEMKRACSLSLILSLLVTLGMLYLQERNNMYLSKQSDSIIIADESKQFRSDMFMLAFANEVFLNLAQLSLFIGIFHERQRLS